MTTCDVCIEPATRSWQRWATEEEVAELHETGDLPAAEGTARLMVYSCDNHALDEESMAATHASGCTAPPACDCSPSGEGGVGE